MACQSFFLTNSKSNHFGGTVSYHPVMLLLACDVNIHVFHASAQSGFCSKKQILSNLIAYCLQIIPLPTCI